MRRMVCGLTGLICFFAAMDLSTGLEHGDAAAEAQRGRGLGRAAHGREAGAAHFSTHWTAPSCRYLVSDWQRS
ncbi:MULTISPECIES: hypothetical protein [unclassified Sphingomonas]|uniref:hypothetical protein n=1 Tax=Sphingomonas TaxID=13687 RepID=UPI001AC7E940|nr:MULTISPECIES: hypothetical protein [unclassified Sphingomonas]MBN8811868.1 hypothetical protein [Sphingomonas sp.]